MSELKKLLSFDSLKNSDYNKKHRTQQSPHIPPICSC